MAADRETETGAPHGVGGAPGPIVRPLAAAGLLTLAGAATFARFLDPASLPATLGRLLANGFCQAMIALFAALVLYAGFQHLSLVRDRRALAERLALAGSSAATDTGRWLSHLVGPPPDPVREFTALRGPRPPSQSSRDDDAQFIAYLLAARHQQHQQRFAPIGFGVWVLPLLGFIGTVVGIGQALGGLEQSVIPATPSDTGLAPLLGGLRFAFDTTFVGLTLVIPTMIVLLALRARAQTLDLVYRRILLGRPVHEADR
ncbi:MotA/TolQ/ExbB proton channel family protein [Thioalkalicoccus limnaeus]|uniref:MotA/TolQ/ExbB proton channel family protein n=1 Tax=Thioalkalicoccus limnaeus TaxID=120681 RepID=A0ABV4BIK0_9GAMM